ncbi:MAG: hypothetical protein ACI4I7_05100 [Oscillospiraceae bacterium]
MKKAFSSDQKLNIKLSSKPEKVIMTTAFAVAGAILFDEKKKKVKHPEKYHNFFQRIKKNYKISDALIQKTLAKDICKEKAQYKSQVLNNLEIEKGEIIDLK